MAYCKQGTIIANTKYVVLDDGRTQDYRQNITYSTIGENNFLYGTRTKKTSGDYTFYEITIFSNTSDGYTRSGSYARGTYGGVWGDESDESHWSINNYYVTEVISEKLNYKNQLIDGEYDSYAGFCTGVFSSNIPIFEAGSAGLALYISTGDDSAKVSYLSDLKTNWKLYIDGTKNPNYKIVWEASTAESFGVADNCKIRIDYVSVDDYNGVYNIEDTDIVQYSQGNLKNNFNNIYNAVYNGSFISSIVKQDIIILFTLEYYENPTVVLPSAESSTMSIRLFYSETNGHMYTSKGFWIGESDDGSTLEVIEGSSGEGDDGYKDGTDDDESDGTSDTVSGGVGALTATYKMTLDRLNQLGSFLWGTGIFDEFSLVNNNPIENIISCKCIPISKDGTQQEIKLGNVSTGTNGDKLSGNFEKISVGSIAISEYYKNFLDYAPYTNIIIYLPYIGFKELDTNMVMGKSVKVDYVVDVITGSCLAQVYTDNVRLYEYNGNMGIDIPITASNRAQVEASYISSAIGVGTSLLAGNVAGAATTLLNSAQAQYHYSQSGSPSPNCIASINRTCYIVVDRPQYQDLSAFNHTRGRKCNLSKTIKDLNGYTICDEHIDLSTISATSEEKDEIREILSSGFFA